MSLVLESEPASISLTMQQIAVLQAVVRHPSSASCPRYPREIVAQLVERQLVRWQSHPDWFKNTDAGIALYQQLYQRAVNRLESEGWRIRATVGGVRGVLLISPTTHEHMLYMDEVEAWASLITPALLSEVQS